MLTKNRLGRVRTVVLTIVALTGLLGMTLQPALARTPDVARPAAAAVADLDIGALINQLRSLILNLQATIDELERALNEAPPAAEVDEDEAEDVDDDDVDDVDEQNEDADDEDEADEDDEDESDEDESDDDHDDHDDQNEHEHDGDEDGDN